MKNHEDDSKQSLLLSILIKAFEKGEQKDATLAELVEEIKLDLEGLK